MFCVFCSGDSDKHVCTIHQKSNLAQIVESKLNSDGFVSNSGKRTKTSIYLYIFLSIYLFCKMQDCYCKNKPNK